MVEETSEQRAERVRSDPDVQKLREVHDRLILEARIKTNAATVVCRQLIAREREVAGPWPKTRQ